MGCATISPARCLLAGDKPLLAAPAMNWRMWEHPATGTQSGAAQGGRRVFVGPNEGGMACGEWGLGRMAEVDEIVSAAEKILSGEADKPLQGRHVSSRLGRPSSRSTLFASSATVQAASRAMRSRLQRPALARA